MAKGRMVKGHSPLKHTDYVVVICFGKQRCMSRTISEPSFPKHDGIRLVFKPISKLELYKLENLNKKEFSVSFFIISIRLLTLSSIFVLQDVITKVIAHAITHAINNNYLI